MQKRERNHEKRLLRKKRKKTIPVSEAILAQTLRKNEGNRSATARELGISYKVLIEVIMAAPESSSLYPFQKIKQGSKVSVSNEQLVKALKETKLDIPASATAVGLAEKTIKKRLRNAEPETPLGKLHTKLKKKNRSQEEVTRWRNPAGSETEKKGTWRHRPLCSAWQSRPFAGGCVARHRNPSLPNMIRR